MDSFATQAQAFKVVKDEAARHARMTAAFFLTVGMDLDAALTQEEPQKEELRRRLWRLIERERLRGAARHWSYDLNRHIALKQALDLLGKSENHSETKTAAPQGAAARKK